MSPTWNCQLFCPVAGQLDTFRIGAVKDLYLPWECGVFQEPLEGNGGQDTRGPDCLQLAQSYCSTASCFLSLGSPGASQILFYKTGWLEIQAAGVTKVSVLRCWSGESRPGMLLSCKRVPAVDIDTQPKWTKCTFHMLFPLQQLGRLCFTFSSLIFLGLCYTARLNGGEPSIPHQSCSCVSLSAAHWGVSTLG